jgi:glycosyltransferase involved in cell wall biosynthesis
MDDIPLVSVLMTAYNREKYIAEAIESVLASTFSNFELIIVDDGSIDRSVEIARGYERNDKRVKVYVNEKNLGDYPNRNKAAAYAVGKYIRYLDSDDVIYPHGLQVMVRCMEKFPNAGFGLRNNRDKRLLPVCLSPKDSYREHFFEYGHFDRPPVAGIIRRDVFNALGGFSGKRMIGDYEFWLKIARYHDMVIIHDDLYWYRSHDEQEQASLYARKNYPQLRAEVLSEALNHPDCPLSKDDIKRVGALNKRTKIKSIVTGVISRIK